MTAKVRRSDQIRLARIIPGFLSMVPESALISLGRTQVLCTATVEEKLPPFLRGGQAGWVTAEYGMLPRSAGERIDRAQVRGGRALEISRLIGRSLRAAVDLNLLGPRTITIDCDVLQADGGTRTAAVTGGWVALALAVRNLRTAGVLSADPLKRQVAAISVGRVEGKLVLDLDYSQDSRAEVDMNIVGDPHGRLIEIQGTAERSSFDRRQLDLMVNLAEKGLRRLFKLQAEALRKGT